MVTDKQVQLLRLKMAQKKTIEAAAVAAGMSARSAHNWKTGPLPSQAKKARHWRTRVDPFDGVWETDIVPLLERGDAGALEATTVLGELRRRHGERFDERCVPESDPGRYRSGEISGSVPSCNTASASTCGPSRARSGPHERPEAARAGAIGLLSAARSGSDLRNRATPRFAQFSYVNRRLDQPRTRPGRSHTAASTSSRCRAAGLWDVYPQARLSSASITRNYANWSVARVQGPPGRAARARLRPSPTATAPGWNGIAEVRADARRRLVCRLMPW
jgi:hypothetical protein